MSLKTLFLTPPFTQLNTPYPATAYLKGFFNTVGLASAQADLGIEVILSIFSRSGLQTLFRTIDQYDFELSENAIRMLHLQDNYISSIDEVISFLQDKNPTLAYKISNGNYLPEAARFKFKQDSQQVFGEMGIRDKARHFATLYLEDLADLIRESVDPHFGFSRYAEQIGMSANTFDELNEELQLDPSFTDFYTLDILDKKMKQETPDLVCVSVPFPGNLYGAFKCAQFIKVNYPECKVSLGGGFVNTELRELSDTRVFDYFDFVQLDDGERPLLSLIEFLQGEKDLNELKRTFVRVKEEVQYIDNRSDKDVPFKDLGCPDYTGLDLKSYLSVLELANPMHRLWSDGCWNKLTMAHGCYWKKCSFCDISLDYIERYTPLTAQTICDRMERLISQTGETGFHFVDEAAPPSVMRDVALEILRRGLNVTWWTNIRFEESFTADLCELLQASGCIAVSGGLEVASDRLLEKMEKGVSVAQVAKVAHNFTQSGIMVHAYLMYGFPTQSDQETIDSLELVRQLFQSGVVKSGFWHRFAMTAHSPVGLDPSKYEVVKVGPEKGGFAYNDLIHEDPLGARHELYSEGLRNSLFHYMRGEGFDKPLSDWFDFKIPTTGVISSFVNEAIMLTEGNAKEVLEKSKLIYLGVLPSVQFEFVKREEVALFEFYDQRSSFNFSLPAPLGEVVFEFLEACHVNNDKVLRAKELGVGFAKVHASLSHFLLETKEGQLLRKHGLIILK